MSITVQGPDKATFEFPDGTDQAVMTSAMQAHYGAPKVDVAPPAPQPGLMQKLSDAITFKNYREEVGKEAGEAKEQGRKALTELGEEAKKGHVLVPAAKLAGAELRGALAPITAAFTEGPGRAVADVANMAKLSPKTPLAGFLTDKRAVGDVASIATPLGMEVGAEKALSGVAKAAGTGVNTMRKALEASKASTPATPSLAVSANPGGVASAAPAAPKAANTANAVTKAAAADPERAKAVAQLQSEGVKLTRGQALGGRDKAIEEAMKSNPFSREGTVSAERASFQSMNRGAYNRALKPIGLAYDPKGPVGYDGIKRVEGMIGSAYDKISPQLKLEHDNHLAMDLDDIKQDVAELPKPQQEQYETIMKNRFFAPLVKHGGVMNGQDFKDMESSISQAAATWKGSPDPAHRELGKALDASLGALRDNLERTSDPSVRDQLKAVNTAWANFVRLQGAAANRVKSEGVFTPGDLLTATKRSDRSVRKGAFARGDALMQDYAGAAQKVMGDTIPDSGTAYRMAQLLRTGGAAGLGGMVGHIPGAIAGAAIEPGTNAAARAYSSNTTADLGRALLQRGSPLTGRNYLSQITRHSSPFVPQAQPLLRLPAAAGAMDVAQGQGQ